MELDQRGCVVQPRPRANRRREEPRGKAKPFDIPKRELWEAFKHVRANQGAAGVDAQSIAEFEADRRAFACFLPAASPKALTSISRTIRRWALHHRSDKSLQDLAEMYTASK